MTREPRPERAETRTRLLAGAMRLFANRGYAGTTVGDIEREAGLAPRSGALYQYFSGKDEILEAAVERELASVDELGSVVATLVRDDLRTSLTRLAEWNLASLARRRDLNRFLARERARLPRRLEREIYRHLVEQPFEQVTNMLEATLPTAAAERFDVAALALVFVQSMAGYRNMQWTFGKSIGDVDDERFVRSWVEVALAVARDAGIT